MREFSFLWIKTFFYFLLKSYRVVLVRGNEKGKIIFFMLACRFLSFVLHMGKYFYVQWQWLFQHESLCTQMYFPGKSCLCCRWQMNWNGIFRSWEIPLNFFNSVLFWQRENSYYFSSWNTLKCCNNELHRTTDRYNRKQGDGIFSVAANLETSYLCLFDCFNYTLEKILVWCHHTVN